MVTVRLRRQTVANDRYEERKFRLRKKLDCLDLLNVTWTTTTCLEFAISMENSKSPISFILCVSARLSGILNISIKIQGYQVDQGEVNTVFIR